MNQTKQRQASPTPCDCSYPIRDSTNKPYQGREQALKTITASYDRRSSQNHKISESQYHKITKSQSRRDSESSGQLHLMLTHSEKPVTGWHDVNGFAINDKSIRFLLGNNDAFFKTIYIHRLSEAPDLSLFCLRILE